VILEDLAVAHDEGEAVSVLEDSDISDRISGNAQDVGTFAHL
jgi:hypothetical protein